MNETLLDKAEHNYNVAVMIYNGMNDDELYLNYVGYHLQQSIELVIKYLLEQSGVTYPKTHDIDQLIRIANDSDVELFLDEYVYEHSEMFTLWEVRTRYVLGYQIELRKIMSALKSVKKSLENIRKHENGVE